MLLVRIDERVKILDERVDKIESKIEAINNFILKKNNHWRERGVVAALVSVIVGLIELLKRVVGGV